MGLKFDWLVEPVTRWLNVQRPPSEVPQSDFERIRYELKPCDVILVEGRSRVSDVIKLITQSPWSHAALYLGRLHDIEDPRLREIAAQYCQPGDESQQFIIESELGLGTAIRPLSVYSHEHLRICRPKGLSYRDAQEVIRYAISRLGAEYDVRQILDLARFMFPWMVLPRRWRSSLFRHNPGQTTKTVCSTMIAEAFGFIQFPIMPLVKKEGKSVQLFRRNPKLCTPSNFDYSPYFEIIKYPFVDFSHHSDHRLLPWQGDMQLQGEESQMYLHANQRDTSLEQAKGENDQDSLH